MASNIGLFTSPEQVLQAEQQLRQQQALQGGFSPISAAAQELGRSVSGAFGKAVGGEGLVSQPAEMARNRMQVLQSADISTREGAFIAAKALRDAGDMEGFAKLTQHGLGIEQAVPKKSNSLLKQEELMAQGLSKETAQGIAFGAYSITTDPTSGDVIATDKRQLGQPRVPGVEKEIAQVVRQGNRKAETFAKKITNLGDDVIKSNIPQAEDSLGQVESFINALREAGETDIPGFGATAMLPTVALSEEGKAMRQRVAKIFNITLKDRSGAAVTTPELTRLKEEFGSGKLTTDKQLLDALQIYRREINVLKKSLAAGYSSDVVSEYQHRGGIELVPSTSKVVSKFKFNPETGELEAK